MSKILDILLIGVTSFGAGWIFGPQIVRWTARTIDETVPKVKDKLDQAKKGDDKMDKLDQAKKGDDKMDKDLKIPKENIILVQDFGNCGYWTYDITNNLNIPTQIVSSKNKWYIGKFPNEYFNNFKIKNLENAWIDKNNTDMLIIPEYFTIKIVDGTDYWIKNFILPKKQSELIRQIVNTKKDVAKIINEDKELQELLKNPLTSLDKINKILNN